jgi:epoxyqueuosine reductase
MKATDAVLAKAILENNRPGIDGLAIIPVIELDGPLEETLRRLDHGLIPSSYHWTQKKTEYAYSFKNYSRWIKSIIVAAKYYYTDDDYPDEGGFVIGAETNGGAPMPYGRIARFTWRNNYRYLTLAFRKLLGQLEKLLGRQIKYRVLSNYTSIPEKVLFRNAGCAEFGKNSVLINRKMGSYFVIGEMLTDLEIDTDHVPHPRQPDFSLCGTCRACIDACPTGAIVNDGVLDVGRCLQYLSENLMPIPREYREKWNNRLYGCSICIDACPYNHVLEPWGEKHKVGYVGPGDPLLSVLHYSQQQWQDRFRDNQIIIRDRLAIVQNALICLGNVQFEEALPTLSRYLEHENPLIRTGAVWAIGRQDTVKARTMLHKRAGQEEDPSVIQEIEFFL